MYLLMNKDKAVALINIIEENDDSKTAEIIETYDKLPIGFLDADTWLDKRQASKHNTHLVNLMKQMGCYDIEGFIRVTHAASINDTFWVKSEQESVSWNQISLYKNEFTETISRLAFEGIGLYDGSFSTTTPELTCDGAYRKCFRKENNIGEYGSDIFLYKRGTDASDSTHTVIGLEPYCEKLACEIAQHISPENAVAYDLVRLHGKLASKCNLFTNENYGYASYSKAKNERFLKHANIHRYFESIGSERQFREMMVIDALCFNHDRHAGNYGVLFDTDTLAVKSMAPVFDLNLSFFPHVELDKFSRIGDVLFKMEPKIGDDFTRNGQIAINDAIRDRVKDMQDFRFSFRGDDKFSPERVKILEELVQKQATALLSKDKLITTDVFFSQNAANMVIQNEKIKAAVKRANLFMDILDTIPLGNADYSNCISTEVVQCYVENIDSMMTIDFLTNETTITHNQKEIQPDKLQECDNKFYNVYLKVQVEWNKFLDNERQ